MIFDIPCLNYNSQCLKCTSWILLKYHVTNSYVICKLSLINIMSYHNTRHLFNHFVLNFVCYRV